MLEIIDVSNINTFFGLTIAPIVLIIGISVILSVLVARLGRIVNCLGALNESLPRDRKITQFHDQYERPILSLRVWLIKWAIRLSMGSIFLLCVAIAMLVAHFITSLAIVTAIAVLVIMAMIFLGSGLVCFLREIGLEKDCIHLDTCERSAESHTE